MANKHWLDALSLTLTQDRPRRNVLKAAICLAPEFMLGATTAAGGRKNNKKRNKGKNHNNPKLKPSKSCSDGACASQWAGNQNEIAYCEFICRQCDGDDQREFCIVEGDPADPSKIAVCCSDLVAPNCCDGKCTNLVDDKKNCGTCGNACGDGQVCRDAECDCVGNTCPCPDGLTRCGDECVDTQTDREHCGGCNAQNVNGLKCCGGNLCTYIDGECCGSTCYPSGWSCA